MPRLVKCVHVFLYQSDKASKMSQIKHVELPTLAIREQSKVAASNFQTTSFYQTDVEHRLELILGV